MRTDDKEESSTQEDTVPDLERATSSGRASSAPVFTEEDAAESVVANNSFVPVVLISEKEDPNSGDGPVITAHQVDDGGDPQPQAPERQHSLRPSATATEAPASNNFARNTTPDEEVESGLNMKMMALKDTKKASRTEADGKGNIVKIPPAYHEPKNRRQGLGLKFGLKICFCLLVVIGIIVALVVTLSPKDEQSRGASFLTNGLTEAPSATMKLTTVPTATPTASTPVPTLTPTDPPTAEQRYCLQGSDACGDVTGFFGISLGTDWQSLSCIADARTLKCTMVACNEVFSIATPWRILNLVSLSTSQQIEVDEDAFELLEGDNLVYSGQPTVRSETEVDIELPVSYFPNIEEIQVWLESSVVPVLPLDPVDRLPNQITLSFSPC